MNKRLLTYTIATIYIILFFLCVLVKSVWFCLLVCGCSIIGTLWVDYFLNVSTTTPQIQVPKLELKPKEKEKEETKEKFKNKIPEDDIPTGVIVSEEEVNVIQGKQTGWFAQMSKGVSSMVNNIENLMRGEDNGAETTK